VNFSPLILGKRQNREPDTPGHRYGPARRRSSLGQSEIVEVLGAEGVIGVMGNRSTSELLTPEEVLSRYTGGPKTGVFTDGSCEGNPGPGGWGFVWVEDDRIVEEKRGTDPSTTNNRMELAALIATYQMLPEDSQITVYSDSQLCVKTVNEWAAGWEKRGWRRKSGPIANLELVREL
jgi:ribonuclease HI